jgi:hypothetical protein
MRTYAIAVVTSLLVSALVGYVVFLRTDVGSLTWFVVCPGLLAFAVTSDMVAKPPVYQSVALFVALNIVWYLALAVVAKCARWAVAKLRPLWARKAVGNECRL